MKQIITFMNWLVGLFIIIFLMTACGGKEEASKEVVEKPTVEIATPVVVEKLDLQHFFLEIISNGRTVAAHKAELRFDLNDQVVALNVENGDWVRKGALIAQLDDFRIRNKFQESKIALENAKISLNDYLIGQGYSLMDSFNIPNDIFKISKVKSGYDRAMQAFDLQQYNLSKCKLVAPISGVVTGLDAKQYSYTHNNEAFCVIVDNSKMEVKFPIMEYEVSLIKKGQEVKILPYYQTKEIEGHIKAINPIIDDNGMAEVVAVFDNKPYELLEGMNVKVVVSSNIGDRLAVSKEAIVLRSEQPVVFTYENGRAVWNNVSSREENSTHKVIVKGLKAGDQIIVDGNLHLADKALVELSK